MKVSAFVVMIAAMCYAYVGIFMNAGAGDVVAEFILSVPGGMDVLFVIMAIVFMLGMFIEWIGIVFMWSSYSRPYLRNWASIRFGRA